MNAAEVMTTLAAEGVELAVKDGRLCVRPSVRDRPALLALVKSHAAELRQLLSEADWTAGLTAADSKPVRWRGAGLDLGDLRPCLWCRNLTRGGRCLAAWRGELRAASDYSPTFPEQPRRCIGYSPSDDVPDQRPGYERWPELVESQAPQPTVEVSPVRARGKQA